MLTEQNLIIIVKWYDINLKVAWLDFLGGIPPKFEH